MRPSDYAIIANGIYAGLQHELAFCETGSFNTRESAIIRDAALAVAQGVADELGREYRNFNRALFIHYAMTGREGLAL